MESMNQMKKISKKPMKTSRIPESVSIESPVENKETEEILNSEITNKSVLNEFKIEMEPFEYTLDDGKTYKISLTSEKDYSISLQEHIHHGEVYLIHNKKNRKIYIGQARCYTSRENKKWGTFGRWRSHLNETFNATKDHCKKLNNAIRKYKPESFEVFMLARVPMQNIDEMEIYLIDYFNSMSSRGYNMRTGGKKGKDSDETRICKSESKQIHPRNIAFVPQPIEEDTQFVIETPLMISKINKKIYRMEKERIQNDFIFPIVENKKILGYRVEGLTYQGNIVQSRDFVGCTNRWNLDQAFCFIEQIKYYDENKIKLKNPHTIDLNYRHKNRSDKYYLPEYLQLHESPYGISGFKINGFPSSDYKNGKVTKTFVDKHKTKDENYEDAIDYLEGLKNGTIQHKKILDNVKLNYNGYKLPNYVSPIYIGKKEENKIRGFKINRFPKTDGTRVCLSFSISTHGSLDNAFQEVMEEIKRLHQEKADALSKK